MALAYYLELRLGDHIEHPRTCSAHRRRGGVQNYLSHPRLCFLFRNCSTNRGRNLRKFDRNGLNSLFVKKAPPLEEELKKDDSEQRRFMRKEESVVQEGCFPAVLMVRLSLTLIRSDN